MMLRNSNSQTLVYHLLRLWSLAGKQTMHQRSNLVKVAPIRAVKSRGLRYVMDNIKGITRRRHGKNFLLQPQGCANTKPCRVAPHKSARGSSGMEGCLDQSVLK